MLQREWKIEKSHGIYTVEVYSNSIGIDNEGQSCALPDIWRLAWKFVGCEELLEHEHLACEDIHRRAALVWERPLPNEFSSGGCSLPMTKGIDYKVSGTPKPY